jgi:hypothetical protein
MVMVTLAAVLYTLMPRVAVPGTVGSCPGSHDEDL